MPSSLSNEQLRVLARHGAAHRIAELEAEIAAIRRAFPRIATQSPGSESQPGRRRRRRMSAAARKAVSERMKKYWATRRSSSKK
jgi:hypothetical protein